MEGVLSRGSNGVGSGPVGWEEEKRLQARLCHQQRDPPPRAVLRRLCPRLVAKGRTNPPLPKRETRDGVEGEAEAWGHSGHKGGGAHAKLEVGRRAAGVGGRPRGGLRWPGGSSGVVL